MNFTLFRFPIKIEGTFLLILLIFLNYDLSAGNYTSFLLKAAGILISFLFHEMGHALMFRKYGIESKMVFHGFGGVCIPQNSRPVTHWNDILITLAGPFMNFVMAGISFLVLKSGMPIAAEAEAEIFFNFFLFINLLWGIFNLIPLLPMDGGMALQSFMKAIKIKKAIEISIFISFAVLAAFAVWCINSGSLWNIALVIFFAYENYEIWQRHKRSKN